jgi:hypothetical protein
MARNDKAPAVVVSDQLSLLDSPWDQVVSTAGTDALPAFHGGSELIDKVSLVGIPFVLLDVAVRTDPTSGRDYRSYTVRTEEGPGVFNDGGSGIAAQLEAMKAAGNILPVFVGKGLRASDYTATTPTGPVKARTYYLA